jgi:anti-sigma B factor antagonist
MNITTTNIESVSVVRLEGNLDTNTSTDAQGSLNQLIDGGASKVLVNFASVDFVSSAGLRILLATAKKLSGSGGNLRISNLNETVSEVFEISGFSTILDVFGSEEEALRGF